MHLLHRPARLLNRAVALRIVGDLEPGQAIAGTSAAEAGQMSGLGNGPSVFHCKRRTVIVAALAANSSQNALRFHRVPFEFGFISSFQQRSSGNDLRKALYMSR